ncbi:MAG: alkaline phosphatase family protein [Verrucomicrobiota bacterium]
MFSRSAFLLSLAASLIAASTFGAALKTENVFLITLDGVRWQEVFSGVDAGLISRSGGVTDTNHFHRDFWRDSREERRAALMPFFWSTVASKGQLLGNQTEGSVARVTNGKNFTYPGFNEILTGFADPSITNNGKIFNRNTTVLEWLHAKPAFTNRVAVFANWDVFPFIMNARRAGIPIWTGYAEGTLPETGAAMSSTRSLADGITPLWPDMNFDVFFFHAALEHVRLHQPRLVWIAFSEPDEWAHEGRYDLYARALNRIDSYVKQLWEAVQAMPEYGGKTTFILTTDHGRGTGLTDWRDHGEKVAGAENIWMAALGPDTAGLGEHRRSSTVYQNQIAATVAAWLGESYNGVERPAGRFIPDLLPP